MNFNFSSDYNTAKKEYYGYSKEFHPDNGGTTEQMQELNLAWEKYIKYSSNENAIDLQSMINLSKNLSDPMILNIELIGSWLWVFFNGKPSADTLKSLKENGFKYASQKKAWIWHDGAYTKRKKRFDINEIRSMHGSKEIKQARKYIG